MLYFALWILFSAGYLISISKASSGLFKRIFPWVLLLLVAGLSGIRWATGTDWESYLTFYESGGDFHDYMSYWHFEPGFKFLIWLLHSLGIGYSVWLFILTFLVLVIKLAPIRERPYVAVCFLVLFGSSMANLFPTRETLAVSLVILSASCLVERRFLLFLFFILLASLFHSTAIVFVFAPLILMASYRTLVLVALIGGILLDFLLYKLVAIVAAQLGLADLLSSAQFYADTIGGRISVLSIAQKVIILLFFAGVLSKCKDQMTRFELASVKLTFFGLIASMVLESGSQIFNRLTVYFVSFEIISVSAILWLYSRHLILRRSYIQLLTLYVSACMFYCIRFCGLLASYPDLYYPFETIFQSSHRAVY